jgi:hypothetical protein
MSESPIPPLDTAVSETRPQSLRDRIGIYRLADVAVGAHWSEYLMELAELGLFMVSACTFTAILGHPSSRCIRFCRIHFCVAS